MTDGQRGDVGGLRDVITQTMFKVDRSTSAQRMQWVVVPIVSTASADAFNMAQPCRAAVSWLSNCSALANAIV